MMADSLRQFLSILEVSFFTLSYSASSFSDSFLVFDSLLPLKTFVGEKFEVDFLT